MPTMAPRHWSQLMISLGLVAAAATGAPPAARPAPRPRVGLVLSGGGALGLAHLGVIRVLEELHVGVDCVAGTSMGAIVGGLYAAGYSPGELEALASSLPWRELMQDRPDRRELPFRRKVDDLTYLSRYEVGVANGGLRLPSGLVLGHKLGLELVMRTLRVASITDFDRLPLPFRAVATDIGTGSMVVLDHGSLGEAMRASMAIPGVFAPATVDGRVLVDGGLVRALPVDVARAMGAEVIIAVDLGQPLAAEASPDSLGGVMARTSAMLTRLNVEKVLSDVDVLIDPDTIDLDALNFSAAKEIVPRGVAAAREQAESLRRLALADDEWQAYLARQRRAAPVLKVGAVTIDAGTASSPTGLDRLVHTRPGQPLDEKTLRADVRRIFNLGEFEAVDISVTPREGAFDIGFRARPKSWGPNFLRFGASVFADLEGQSEFNILTDLTMTRFNRTGGEFKTAAQMGQAPLIATELFQPLSSARTWFVAASAQGAQLKRQVQVGDESVQYRFQLASGALDLGLQLGRWGEVRLGLVRSSVNGEATSKSDAPAPDVKRLDTGWSLRCVLDQLDNTSFPRRGFLLTTSLYDARSSLGADVDYRKLTVEGYAVKAIRRHSLALRLRGVSALGGHLPPGELDSLGGLFSLSGLPVGEITGSYGGVVDLLYSFRVAQPSMFFEGLYLGLSLEAGNLWETPAAVSLDDLHESFAVFLGADTPIGPVYLAHGVSDTGKDSLYLYLGRTF